MKMHLVMILMLALSAVECKDIGVEPGPPDIPVAELLAAPDTVRINGASLVLSSYLWRDFMPISPRGGKPLGGVLTIRSTDSTSIPRAITADAAWLVLGSDVWKVWTTDSPANDPLHFPYRLEKNVRNGPLWGPGVTVSVIVRIRDTQGNAVLLRASGQWIGRTD